MRSYYEVNPPQTTFVQNVLGKNVQVSNDSDSQVIAHFGDAILRLSPGQMEYLVMPEEAQVFIHDDNTQYGPYYTRSDANMVSIRRDVSGRMLPVYFFARF